MAMADEDFGDAELWAAIDSAAAARYAPASASNKSIVLSRFHQQSSGYHHRRPLVELPPSPETALVTRSSGASHFFQQRTGEVSRCRVDQLKEDVGSHGLKRQQQTDFQDGHVSVRQKHCDAQKRTARPLPQDLPMVSHENSPPSYMQQSSSMQSMWTGGVPSSAVFRRLQDSAMAVLEKGDYIMMQGKPFIKKSGWRKIAFFFNISFEIKDRKIDFDQNSNVLRAEFVIRASMQSGRFSDGWGSCDLREKRFSKPNHDIPSTAETRAKTRACQDLLGIGEYKPGTDNW